MGLAERRAAKEFETNSFPRWKKDVDTAATFDVPLEVKWDQLTVDDYAHLYSEAWSKVYFEPLVTALKSICVDDLGRDALKSALKKVVIQNTAGIYYGDRMATFQNGVLTLDHQPCSNVDNVKERCDGIQQVLEKAL